MDVEGALRVRHEQMSANLSEASASAVTIELTKAFHCHREAAVLRLQSQYPRASFAIADCGIVVTDSAGVGDIEIRKAVLHAVYAETLSMRQALVAAVTSR